MDTSILYVISPVLGLLLEFTGYLAGGRESACFEFGKNEFVIYDNIKDTVSPWDQPCLHTQSPAQFIRQTGGVRFIVSLGAIMNVNFHHMPPAATGQ